jgi:hypothetical protein
MGRSTVAMLPNGGYVAAYFDSNAGEQGNRGRLFIQLYDGHGNKVGGAKAIATTTASQQSINILALNEDGDFAVSWNESTNGTSWSY